MCSAIRLLAENPRFSIWNKSPVALQLPANKPRIGLHKIRRVNQSPSSHYVSLVISLAPVIPRTGKMEYQDRGPIESFSLEAFGRRDVDRSVQNVTAGLVGWSRIGTCVVLIQEPGSLRVAGFCKSSHFLTPYFCRIDQSSLPTGRVFLPAKVKKDTRFLPRQFAGPVIGCV